MKLRAYITHKAAEKYSDCADYFGICPLNNRVAVSDGVSQSIMPLEWAKILVNAFLDKSWNPKDGVSSLQGKWLNEAISYLNEQRALGKNPWMLENCITNQDGAGATFCGIEFFDESNWNAKILGDSCLVLIDENNEITEIISSKEGKFDNRPDYFDSFKEQRGKVREISGSIKRNQKLLLVSDPFSELFQIYHNSAEGKIIIDKLLSLKSYEEYIQLVDVYRDSYHMHNDDSTLIIVEYDGKIDFDILVQSRLEELQEQEIKLEKKAEADKNKREDEEAELWNKTLVANSIEAYQKYLESSVLKKYQQKAEVSINALLEQQKELEEWQKAECENSLDSYNLYLDKFPKGLHSQDAATRIDNLRQSSESARCNVREEHSESSTEDDDRCGQEKYKRHSPELPEAVMEHDSKLGAEPAIPVSVSEEGTEPAIPVSAAEEGKESASPVSAAEESAEPTCSVSTIKSSTNPTGTTRPWCAGYSQDVANQITSEESTEIVVPSTVNSLDGIDRMEFRDLLSTATTLFLKHSPAFKEALKQNWRRPEQKECFRIFWLELEEIIYK